MYVVTCWANDSTELTWVIEHGALKRKNSKYSNYKYAIHKLTWKPILSIYGGNGDGI